MCLIYPEIKTARLKCLQRSQSHVACPPIPSRFPWPDPYCALSSPENYPNGQRRQTWQPLVVRISARASLSFITSLLSGSLCGELAPGTTLAGDPMKPARSTPLTSSRRVILLCHPLAGNGRNSSLQAFGVSDCGRNLPAIAGASVHKLSPHRQDRPFNP